MNDSSSSSSKVPPNKGQLTQAVIFLVIHGIVSVLLLLSFVGIALLSFFAGGIAFLFLIPLLTILAFLVSLMFLVKQKPEISSRISGITLILVILLIAYFAVTH